jgi:hypothetical protein
MHYDMFVHVVMFERIRTEFFCDCFFFISERGRSIVECVECGKSRVVYSMYKPSDVEKKLLEIYLGSISFMCGFPLFTQDCELYKKFVVREQMSCCYPMEATYYSKYFRLFQSFL